jgi:hypothetical protein
MNTPQQQAELYRKAAETIEMCAKHGIEPLVKIKGNTHEVNKVLYQLETAYYDFPIAVIEGKLVWSDTVVYNPHWINGRPAHVCSFTPNNDASWSLTPPKQPLCEVEGKPVYKGDRLYFTRGCPREVEAQSGEHDGRLAVSDGGIICTEWLSWNPPKRTVMVEMLTEDAELHANIYSRLGLACKKAIDNLKGE